MEDKRESEMSDEKHLKIMPLRNREEKSRKDLRQQLREASDPSVVLSTICHQRWSPWKGGCQEAIINEYKHRKGCGMPNDTRTGLKISSNRSNGGINSSPEP